MSLPPVQDIDAAISETWPAKDIQLIGNVALRSGGGGQRATAATVDGAISIEDIEAAEAAMLARGESLFRVRPGQSDLDQTLEARGYNLRDATNILVCATNDIATQDLPPVSAFTIWPPLAIMDDIWNSNDIGPARRAVMERCLCDKVGIFGRSSGQPAGVGFIAAFGSVAMVHAVAVQEALRRQKTAENMMIAGAKWAQDIGAEWISALCTRHNLAANALYTSLGMKVVGTYHYRAKKPG